MNQNKEIFGRITINGEKQSIGYGTMQELMLRASHKWGKAKAKSGNNIGIIEVSDDPLPDKSILDTESQLLHEFNSLAVKSDDDEPSGYGTLTWGQISEIIPDSRFKAYQTLAADPQQRVGMSPEEIQTIKQTMIDWLGDNWDAITPWKDS